MLQANSIHYNQKSDEICWLIVYQFKHWTLAWNRNWQLTWICDSFYIHQTLPLTYLPIIIIIFNGGILSPAYSHHIHYWQIPTMVGFCHGGNVLRDRHHHRCCQHLHHHHDIKWHLPLLCLVSPSLQHLARVSCNKTDKCQPWQCCWKMILMIKHQLTLNETLK